jgi:hypothetical protein
MQVDLLDRRKPSQQGQQARQKGFRPICDHLDRAFIQRALAEAWRLVSDEVKAGLLPK